MASLWKRRNSPYWVCCYDAPNGRRFKKSTKQTERKKALAMCVAWEQAAERGGHGVLTEVQARRVISQIVEMTTGEPIAFHTSEDWFREWLVGKKQTKAKATHERYQHVLEAFIKHLGKRAKLNLAHLTPKDLRSFRDAELAEGKSPKTCNLAMKTIGAALNAARRQGFLPTNPAEALEPLPHESESKDTFSPEQVTALLAAAPVDWKGAILTAFYTGARLRDVCNLRWDAVDLPGRVLRITPMKTRNKEVAIPLHPRLESYFLELPSPDSGKAFVFSKLAGRGTGGAHGLSKTFAGIMAHAGISSDLARPRTGQKGRAMSKLSFHSLRHSFNSMMANRGIDQEIRQKLTGHASAEMNRVYTHHELNTLRAAIEVLPSV